MQTRGVSASHNKYAPIPRTGVNVTLINKISGYDDIACCYSFPQGDVGAVYNESTSVMYCFTVTHIRKSIIGMYNNNTPACYAHMVLLRIYIYIHLYKIV